MDIASRNLSFTSSGNDGSFASSDISCGPDMSD
jgi:hypothetical protein